MIDYKSKYASLSKRKLDDELILSCSRGSLEEVEYLLTSEDLSEKADIDSWSGECFLCACKSGNLNLIDFLLFSKKISKNANPHMLGDQPFLIACKTNNVELVKYFFNVCKFEKNEDIVNILNRFPKIKF